MTSETYQGWTNRETWCVSLWINNDAGLQETALSLVAEHKGDVQTSHALESWVGGIFEDASCDVQGAAKGWAGDLFNCALARVNWVEIAHALREP